MKIRKTKRNGKVVWEFDTGLIEGKRRRLFFRTEKAARLKQAELKSDFESAGHRWFNLSSAAKAKAMHIFDQLEAKGVTLEQVWTAFQTGKLDHAKAGKQLGEAIEEVLTAKKAANRRPTYLAELQRYLGVFAKGREAMDVGEFGVIELEGWFTGRKESPAARAGNIGKLSALFDHCWRRGYIPANPCLRLEKPHVEIGVPKIFSVEQCERLMQTAWKTDKELIPELALGLFAGVRPNEIARLSFDKIDLDRHLLTIDAAASKVRNRRIVALHPTCVAWLKLGGPLPVQLNHRRRMNALKEAAGIESWPHDVLRHTAASHLVALHGAKTAAEMLGHSETMLFKHYRELVRPDDSKRFWNNLPS